MSPAVPPLVELTYVLPTQLPLLAQALAPVAKAARRALKRKVQASGQDFVLLDDLSRHMGCIERALHRLIPRLEDLLPAAIREPSAGPLEVGRCAGRLEQVLSELVDGYLDTKASHAGTDSAEARVLLLGVYRHHILNICSWLDEIVFSITNPALAIQKRGIEPSEYVELNVEINMTSPPQMAKLDALVKRLQHRQEAEFQASCETQHARARSPGLLATVGALAFGFGLSDAVLSAADG